MNALKVMFLIYREGRFKNEQSVTCVLNKLGDFIHFQLNCIQLFLRWILGEGVQQGQYVVNLLASKSAESPISLFEALRAGADSFFSREVAFNSDVCSVSNSVNNWAAISLSAVLGMEGANVDDQGQRADQTEHCSPAFDGCINQNFA